MRMLVLLSCLFGSSGWSSRMLARKAYLCACQVALEDVLSGAWMVVRDGKTRTEFADVRHYWGLAGMEVRGQERSRGVFSACCSLYRPSGASARTTHTRQKHDIKIDRQVINSLLPPSRRLLH